MSDKYYIITLHHKLTATPMQYFFENGARGQEAYEAILQSRSTGNPAEITHLAGKSTIDGQDFCEVSLGNFGESMSQFTMMQEAQLRAQVHAQVKAQQATRHLARLASPAA